MTRLEFQGQFMRLCKGFTYSATAEQADAWYRRIGHVALEVWAESVTNLLCSERFPRDLDRVLAVVDTQAQASRAKAIQRDRPRAERVHEAISRGAGFDPTLFQVIKAYAGREQVQAYQRLVLADDEMPATTKRLELARIRTEEARLNEVIRAGIPSVTEDDAYRLMQRFEPVAA